MTDIKNYALVTGAYWGFTLTDGALRMLVLLHFHELGYSAVQIAFLFLRIVAGNAVTICKFFNGRWGCVLAVGMRYDDNAAKER